MNIKLIRYKYSWQFKISRYLPSFINKIIFKNYRTTTIYSNCIPSGFSLNFENPDKVIQQITFNYNEENIDK
jgi:hypothetical protein